MDVVVLRALVEGDDSALNATLARADKNILDFANKSRPAPKLVASVDTAQASRNVGQLERDIDRLRKKAVGINFGVNIPKNAARDLEKIADILPRIKSTKAVVEVDVRGNADLATLRGLVAAQNKLSSKTVTYDVNWKQTGAPPTPPVGGGNGGASTGSMIHAASGPRPQAWDNRMEGLQMHGYRNVASGSMLIGSAMIPAGLAAGAVKFAGDYEEAMQHVITLTDVTKGEIETLKRQVISLSGDPAIRQGPTELADALYYVTSTGLKGADGMKVLRAAALGASAGLGEAQVVANTITTVLDAYGLSAEHAMRATDTLTQAVKFGKGEATEYAAAFPKLIAIAAQAGVSFEEVAAQMASATRLGLTPSESATALRQIFNNLIDPSEKAKKAMKEMGTSVGELRIMLKEKGLFNTLKDLQERTGGRIGPITELFGSIRALTGFLSTTGNATLSEYRKTLDGINEGAGATATAAQTASETMNFSFDRVKNALERAGIAFGKSFQPLAEKAATWLERDLPAAGQVASRTWDDMGEGTQGFIVNLGKLMLAAGGLKILVGTMQILGSAVGGLFTVAMGIPAIAGAL
ncbi:MAG: phage tail tape measure protein, partial [Armatimonadetes bacterium]|nr:phage tail tape measure protein [Armatimonadota bacterium]